MRYLRLVFAIIIGFTIGCLAPAPPIVAQDPLTEIYTSSDGSITFHYPSGWQVYEEASAIVLGNRTDALNTAGFEPGMFVMTLLPSTFLNRLYLDTGQDLTSYYDGLIASLNSDDTFSEFVPTDVNGIPALISVTASDTAHGMMVMIDYPTGRVLVACGYSKGEIDLYYANFFAIIESIAVQAAPISTLEPKPIPSLDGVTIRWQVIRVSQGSPDLRRVYDMALDPISNLLYVATGATGVTVLDLDGHVVTVLPIPTFEGGNVVGVGIARDGTLWAADVTHQRLHHLDRDGPLLESVDVPSEIDPLGPYQLHIGRDDRLYLLNQTRDHDYQMVIFGPDGTFERELTLPEPTAFASYGRFAIAPDGTLYLSVQQVTTTLHIALMDTDGTLLREIPLIPPTDGEALGPIGAIVVLADSSFWATDSLGGVIYHFDSTGAILTTFGRAQTDDLNAPFAPGEFSHATSTGLKGLVVLLPDGDVVVGDMNATYTQVIRIHFGE